MKPLLLTLSLLLLTLLQANAVKRPNANPINIAIQLVEKTDSAKVASTLEYYGYSYQGNEDGYSTMKDSNGNEIRFTFPRTETSVNYPIVIVKAKNTYNSIDSRLIELDFEKEGKIYKRKRNIFSRYLTQCEFGSKDNFIVKRVYNDKLSQSK